MHAGARTNKFTCLIDQIEVRGTVVEISSDDDGHPTNIEIAPDPNYRHLVLPPPAKPSLHCEAYPSLPYGGCANNPEWPYTETPTVLDNGVVRTLEPGMHIRVFGSWVVENDHGDPQFLDGLSKWRFIFTELHPYYRRTISLVRDLQPGQAEEQTLAVRAPIYTKVFSDTWWYNKWWGIDRCVVKESIQNLVSVDWLLPTPPLLRGGIPNVTHVLTPRETVQLGSIQSLAKHETRLEDDGLHVRISINGVDPVSPNPFKALYRLSWESPRMRLTVSPDSPADGQQTVSIAVVDERDSSPIDAAAVSIDGQPQTTTDTGGKASFTFTFAEGKIYRLEVDKPPFAAAFYDLSVPTATDLGTECDQITQALSEIESQVSDLRDELAAGGAAPRPALMRQLQSLEARMNALRARARVIKCPGFP